MTAETALASEAATCVAGLRDITAGGASAWAAARLERHVEAACAANRRAGRVAAGRHAIVALGAVGPLITIAVAAAVWVPQGEVTLPVVLGALTYVQTGLAVAVRSAVHAGSSWLLQLSVNLAQLARRIGTGSAGGGDLRARARPRCAGRARRRHVRLRAALRARRARPLADRRGGRAPGGDRHERRGEVHALAAFGRSPDAAARLADGRRKDAAARPGLGRRGRAAGGVRVRRVAPREPRLPPSRRRRRRRAGRGARGRSPAARGAAAAGSARRSGPAAPA